MVYTSRIRGNADRRPKAFWGALIPAAINFVGGLITSSQQAKAQKRALEEQQRLAQQQLQVSNQNNLATTLNNYASANNSYSDEDYNLKYRNGGTRRLGSNGITITDGGNARRIGNNTFLLRGGSHEDINETGQTGIGINVGGNEIEAEGGEVAQKKNKSLRIFSAQPMLSGGLSPAQAIIRGYNKDKVFAAQQRFKRNNNFNDDGSKFGNGGVNKIYNNYSTTYKNRTTRGNKLSIKKGKVYLNNKPAYAGYKWFDRGNKVDYVVNKDGSYSIYKIHGEFPLSRRDESREHYNSIADRVLNVANKTNTNLPLNKTMVDEMKFVKSRLNKENDYIIPNYLPNVKSIKLNTKTKDSTKSVFKDVEIPTNMIDSIYKWTKEANKPLYKGFGLIGETSAGKQPPFTKNVAHIVRTPYNFKLVKGKGYYYPTDLANIHHYFISPQTDNIASLINQGLVVPIDDFKKANYLPRTAAYKGDIKNDKIVDEKLKYIRKNDGYSEHPFIHALQYLDKDNYGMGKNYPNIVKERGNEFLTDKNVQKRINYIRKNNMYKCGGRIKARGGLTTSYRTITDGGIPGTDTYSSRMRSGYNGSPLNLLNILGYADQAVGFTDENGNTRYITGIAPAAGRGKFKGRSRGKRISLADIKRNRTNLKPKNTITKSSTSNVNFNRYTYEPSFRINRNQIGYRGIEDYKPNPNYIPNKPTNTNFPTVISRTPNYSNRDEILREQLAKNKDLGNAYLLNRAAKNANESVDNINKALKRATIAKGIGKLIVGGGAAGTVVGGGWYFGNKIIDNYLFNNKTNNNSATSNYIITPRTQKSYFKPTVKKNSNSTIPNSIRRPQIKKNSVTTSIFKQALGKDSVKKDTTRTDTTKQVNKVVKRQVRTTPQYTGNTTKGNYQLHDGETKVINDIKYTRRGNTIINHKTNVGYIYDKNGNYTGQADYSKVGNFNQAFDAARAAGRSQFIYRAGKYNNYSTAKETNAKKEALNRRIGARRIAKRFGGIEHARRRAALGTQSRYGFIGDGQFYYDKNRASYVDNPYYEMSGTIPEVVVTAPKKTSIDLSTTPYLGRQNTFKPAAQDYIGLGIDTLAALGSGLFTRSAYNKMNFDYALPNYVDESPVAFDTIYHNEAQRANVERNRLNSRNLIRGNTSSAQTALGRMQQTDIDAMMELNKLADEKANKEVELRNQNAANEQQVRARNAAARNQYYQNVAQIKNAALEAKNNAALTKAQSIGADLSGLSQAWTNFAGSVEQRYNTRQNEAIIAATSKEPAVLSNALQFGYNFSPEVLASIYRSTNDDKLKQLALSRLSPSDRRRYSLFQ